MPTFVLKKYTPSVTPTEQTSTDETNQEANQQAEQVPKEAECIEINASDSIAKIVAQALYKAMPNVEIVRKEEAEKADTEASSQDGQDSVAKVISTEEINHNPVDTLRLVGNSKCVLILNEGFKTAKEEWFLQTLESRGVKPFFTVSSFVRHVQATLD